MIARLLDLFEGPASAAAWTPPEAPEPLHTLLPWRAWDERNELYVKRGEPRLRAGAAAVRGDRRGGAGGVGGDVGRRRSGPLRGSGRSLGESALRSGAGGVGRGAAAARRRAGGDRGAARAGVRPCGLAPAAYRRPALHLLGLPGVRDRLPAGPSRSVVGNVAVGVPARTGGNAVGGRGADAASGARRAAVAGGGTCGAGDRRLGGGAAVAAGAALVAAGSLAPASGGARAGVERDADRAAVPPSRRDRCCGAGAVGGGVPGSVAWVAGQCADRRLPPRPAATGRSGADGVDGAVRRRRRWREGVPQVGACDAAGGHGYRALPARPSREGARLALRRRAPQGRRASGARGLLRGGLCAGRRHRRGGAGGARHLSRPGAGGWRPSATCNCRRGWPVCRWLRPAVWTPIWSGWAARGRC